MWKPLTAFLLAYISLYRELHCVAADEQKTPPLPNIWGRPSPRAGETGSFRIMSEIRLADNGGSFVLEEWASGENKLFRFDSLPMESDKPAGRRTVIVKGERNERYIYEPFRCTPLADEMLGKMPPLQLFPNKHDFVIVGLGSIWLYALAEGRKVTFKAAQAGSAEQDRGDKKQRQTIKKVLAGYDQFTVDGDTDFPFRIELYFQSNGLRPDGSGIDPETLAAIHLVDRQSARIMLAAKIIDINTQIRAAVKIMKQPELFDLPLGYGCVPVDPLKVSGDNGQEITYKSPKDCYERPVGERPHVCNIEVVALLPENPDEDMDKWKTHTGSLRFASGILANSKFVIQERREFARIEHSNASSLLSRKSVVRRTKRIWALGEVSQAEESNGRPILFQLGEQMKVCESVRTARLNEVPAMEFQLAMPASECQGSNGPSNDQLNVKLVGGPSLDPEMMRELFTSNDGYHLIRANLDPWVKFRDAVQEKRLKRFELRGSADGQVIWAGPVSVVRRFFVASQTSEELETMIQPTAAEGLDVHVDLYLFSKQLDQILARIHLRLSPAQPVDEAYLHRELDITACLLASSSDGDIGQATSLPFKPIPKPKGSLDYVVTYPLDLDDDTAELLVRHEEEVYSKFLNNLIASNDQKLDPLQVSGLDVDIEYDRIKVSGTLLKWPELFSFTKTAKTRFSRAAKRELLLGSELKGSDAACAASCSHIGCSSFVYCSRIKICELAAEGPARQAGQIELESSDESCNLWTKRHATDRALDHVTPAQVFNKMRNEILSITGDDDKLNPVGIPLDLDNKSLLLLPNAINTRDNQFNDNSILVNDDGHIADFYEISEAEALDGSKEFVQAEFEVLFEGRKLVWAPNNLAAFPYEEASHMDYEDCERFCRENDCKSFSHCRLEGTCLISQLDQTSSIETASEKDDFCYLLARMPLSKFHKISHLSPPSEVYATQSDANRTSELMRRQNSGSSRDCAIQCLDKSDKDFICKSFYFCHGAINDCLLMTERQPVVEVDDLMDPKTDGQQSSEPSCDLYQRSNLIDYNRFSSKEMDLGIVKDRLGAKVSLFIGLDADACASECSHAIEDCIAFQVCSQTDSEKAAHQLRCAILTNTIEQSDSLKLRLDMMSQKLLKESKICTTFVGKIQKARRALEQQIDHSSNEAIVPKGSSWFISSLIVLAGIALGYAITWMFVVRCPRLSVASMYSSN